jgi:hypothetical protein
MEYIRNMFYRVVYTQNTQNTQDKEITVVEETQKNLNLKNYKIDFEKFDKEVDSIIKQNMFYKKFI